jgi:mucin-2
MIKKFVLVFLLLFFSSVSFAANTFFSSFSEASFECQSQLLLYNSLIDSTAGYYQCDYTKFSNNREDFALWYYKKFYLGDFRSSFAGNSRTCNLPDSVSATVTDPQWTNSCTPSCSDDKHPNLAGENGITYPAQICVANPVCTLPKVLNPDKNSCIDNPFTKRWYSDKSSAQDACSADNVNSYGSTISVSCVFTDQTPPDSPAKFDLMDGSKLLKNYSVCHYPKLVNAAPADGFENSCVPQTPPTCTAPQVLNAAKDACMDKPICTAPKILNADKNACIDNPCPENQVMDSFTNQCVASKSCSDGSLVPFTSLGSCPEDSIFCSDGSIKPVGGTCPTNNPPPDAPKVDCGGGVTVQVPFSCPPAEQPPSCPSGQVSGYLNGAFVCVDGGGSSSSTSSTSSTSSGSTSGSTSGDTSGSTSTSSGSTSGSTTSGSTTSSGDTSGSTTSGSTTSGSTTSSGDTSGGTTSGSTTSSGDTSGGTTSGSTTSSGDTSGSTTSGSTTSGSTTSGSTTSGSTTSGSTTSGSTTSSGDTSGGTTSGSTTSSGDTSGSTTSGSTTSSGDTSGSTSGSTTSGGSTSGSTTSGSTTSGSTTSGSTSSGSSSGTLLTCVDGHPTDVNGFCSNSGGSGGITTSSGGGDCPLGKHREVIGTYADGSPATTCILDSCPAGQVYESAWHICVTPSDFPCMDGQAKVNGICPPQSCGQHEYLSGGSCLPVQPVICVDGSTVYPPFVCPPDNNPPPSCPQNQCSGYFNGSFVCVNCGGSSSSSGSTSGSTSTSSGSTSSGSTSTSSGSTSGSTSTSSGSTTSGGSGSSGSSNGDSQGIIDSINSLKGGTPQSFGADEHGDFDDSIDSQIDSEKQALDDQRKDIVQTLQTSFSSVVPQLTQTAASLPCFSLGTVMDIELETCLSDYEEQLSVIGSIIIVLAFLIALSISLGA